MDTQTALAIIRTPVFVSGRSDAALAAEVQNELNGLVAEAARKGKQLPAKPVTEAAGVGNGIYLTPLEAMLQLARVTSPRVSQDIFAWYVHWAWLRYLGVFDQHPDGRLRLSDSGQEVRANQRRVMSEDLGVGFGVVVADRWCLHLGATTPVNVVDVDIALREDLHWFDLNGARVTVGDRQPDYLLVYADRNNQRQFTYKALECKGSVSQASVKRQLARAVTQLGMSTTRSN